MPGVPGTAGASRAAPIPSRVHRCRLRVLSRICRRFRNPAFELPPGVHCILPQWLWVTVSFCHGSPGISGRAARREDCLAAGWRDDPLPLCAGPRRRHRRTQDPLPPAGGCRAAAPPACAACSVHPRAASPRSPIGPRPCRQGDRQGQVHGTAPVNMMNIDMTPGWPVRCLRVRSRSTRSRAVASHLLSWRVVAGTLPKTARNPLAFQRKPHNLVFMDVETFERDGPNAPAFPAGTALFAAVNPASASFLPQPGPRRVRPHPALRSCPARRTSVPPPAVSMR